jgi:hypothetical protein
VAGQEELTSEISAIKTGQSEFKEIITDMLDRQLKGVMAVVKQKTQNLRKEFDSELYAT